MQIVEGLPRPAALAWRSFLRTWRFADWRPASPAEDVALHGPALRARRLLRVQLGLVVLVGALAGLLGMLAVALPADDRWLLVVGVGVVATLGGLVVGLVDYLHGRSIVALARTASDLRQSAAERAAELARANAALRRHEAERATLFAMMSHELRTPLNAIIGFSGALLDDGPLTDEQRDDLAQIHQGANSLLAIVNGTLDLARLEAGALPLSCAPVPVRPVVEQVVALLHPLAAERGLDLERVVSSDLPPVLADEERLRQVLVNLVGNAIKFTPSGRVTVGAEAAGEHLTLSVRDTGIGIPPEAQALIFEPFRQISSGLDRRHGGTGLGLAITQRLVSLMGGTIWVESEPGDGSTFLVRLPAAPASPAAEPPARLAGACAALIVGDADRTRALVDALARRGVRASVASAGEMRAVLEWARPHVVLVEAGVSDVQAWRRLAELSAWRERGGRALGLVALGGGGGRLLLPGRLDVIAEDGLDLMLGGWLRAMQPWEDGAGPRVDGACVLVAGADAAWRRRVATIVRGAGLKAAEAASVEGALAATHRAPALGVVADLLVPEPGIGVLLAELAIGSNARPLPALVVGPTALTPRQQAKVRRSSAAWLGTAGRALDDLAQEIAAALPDWPASPMQVREAAWHTR